MEIPRLAFLAAAFGMALSGTNMSHAGEAKFPKDKDPAFTLTTPDDWKIEAGGARSLNLKSRSGNCQVSFDMIEVATKAKTPSLEELQKSFFSSGKFEDSHKKKDSTVSGKKGETFFGIFKPVPTLTMDVELTLVKLDEKHIARIMIFIHKPTPEEEREVSDRPTHAQDKDNLDKIIKSIHFTEAK